MLDEPSVKRAVSFIDGQNLFRHAKDAFGHHHPNNAELDVAVVFSPLYSAWGDAVAANVA